MTVPLRQIPNVLTFLRILLVIPFAASLFYDYYRQALAIFFIAGLSDGIDGFIARHFNWKSRLGAIADPLADKLLLVTAYIVLTIMGHLPTWLTVLVFSRDIIIVVGALIYHYFIGQYRIMPSVFGKLNTFVQIIYALVIIMHLAGFSMPSVAIAYGLYLVAFLAVLSGIHYIVVWSNKGLNEIRNQRIHGA